MKKEGGLRLQGKQKTSSEEKPLITVVTVVFNGGEYLEETIRSVIEQDYENVEYVIIDGGSTDRTIDVIRKYEHAVDYWVSEPDKGVYDAMNKGIDLARGEWVNFMNAGDLFYSDVVLRDIPFIKMRRYSLIYGDMIFNGEVVKAFSTRKLHCGVIHACHQSMFFALSDKQYLRYNLKYRIYSDYDLVSRIYCSGQGLFYYEKPVSIYQGGGISALISWRKRYDKYHSVLCNFGFLGLLKSLLDSLFGRRHQ